MFKRPEEFIMLVLALLWVVSSYFIALWLGVSSTTALLTAALTLICSTICFVLWQKNLNRHITPLFAAALLACWFPTLDSMAGVNDQTPLTAIPFYADFGFKCFLLLIPIAIGYFFKWKQHKKHKNSPHI